MHAFVTSKNVKWCHLIWPTLYIIMVVIGIIITPQLLTDELFESQYCNSAIIRSPIISAD